MRAWRAAAGLLCVALAAGAAQHDPRPARLSPPGSELTAVSADGRFVLVAQAAPPCLVVIDAARGIALSALLPTSRDGRVAQRIAALRTAPLRRSFIVAPADVPEIWEISYDPRAEEIYDGLVHDYRFGEGVPRRGFLGLKRTTLPEPLADFVFDEHEAEAWGLAAPPPAGSGEGQVINLDVRRHLVVVPAAQMRVRMQSSAGSAQPPAGAEPAPRRLSSKPWPCVAPKVPTP